MGVIPLLLDLLASSRISLLISVSIAGIWLGRWPLRRGRPHAVIFDGALRKGLILAPCIVMMLAVASV